MHIWCKEWGVADTLASIERLNYVVQQDGITCVSNTSVLASSLAKSVTSYYADCWLMPLMSHI